MRPRNSGALLLYNNRGDTLYFYQTHLIKLLKNLHISLIFSIFV